MDILFISYGKYEYDGRLRELMKVANQLGETQYIIRGNAKDNQLDKNHRVITSNNEIIGYIKFILLSIFKALIMKKIDILFIDNRRAVVPGLIIKLIKKPKYVIQDVRELYIIDEINHITGKIGCIFERKLIKKADIVICANKYRAEIMKEYYNLSSEPLVYENIRRLEYSSDYNEEEMNKKYGYYFSNSTIKIVSTSGCEISRTNDKLVHAMAELGEKYELFLIGGGSKQDVYEIKRIIQHKKLNNVHLIEKLGMNELKYFIRNCHIGIVNYNKKDMNNKYCASGKIYEYLFEGKPVVTTENIPLLDLCNTHKIGLADDDYVDGIKKVAENYNYYTENVKKFIEHLSVEDNNEKLVKDIKSAIQKNM